MSPTAPAARPWATLHTARMLLRPPRPADAEAIFARYASDPAVGRWMSWLVHRSVDETRAFVAAAAAEWERWPAGAYLLFTPDEQTLLGGTGLHFEPGDRAVTGYVLARDAWGRGLATEALGAMVALAARLGVVELTAECHPDNRASVRVLEKQGFVPAPGAFAHFPNVGEELEALVFVRTFPPG